MRRRRLAWMLALGLLAAAGAVVTLPPGMRWRADNAVWRGMRIAGREGCFACHLAPGRELANPGSAVGTVPAFASGSSMMYVARAEEIEEWIRNGHTRALRSDPEKWAAYRAQLLQMPAFGERLGGREIGALRAWVVAVDGYFAPPQGAARAGAELARGHCLPCHNAGGAGGLPNPGSPFGYIPGWWGSDFEDLVSSEEELREWIETGSSRRVAAWPLARWFWSRQRIRMPAYGERLATEQVNALIAYIRWLGATEGGTREAATP